MIQTFILAIFTAVQHMLTFQFVKDILLLCFCYAVITFFVRTFFSLRG